MKKIVVLLSALVVMAGLMLSVAVTALPLFLQQILQLHSAALFAAPVSVSVPHLDRHSRSASWRDWHINLPDSATSPLRINAISLVLPPNWLPDASSKSFLPVVMPLESVQIDGVELIYDIDREQLSLRDEFSPPVSYGELQRPVAAAVAADGSAQRFLVQQLSVKNIRVQGFSARDPGKKPMIPVGDLSFTRLGESGGVTAAAMTQTVSRAVFAEVQRQALALRVIEVPRAVEQTEERRRSPQRAEEENASAAREREDSKVKRAAKSVGQGAKDLGRGIKKGFKDLFN